MSVRQAQENFQNRNETRNQRCDDQPGKDVTSQSQPADLPFQRENLLIFLVRGLFQLLETVPKFIEILEHQFRRAALVVGPGYSPVFFHDLSDDADGADNKTGEWIGAISGRRPYAGPPFLLWQVCHGCLQDGIDRMAFTTAQLGYDFRFFFLADFLRARLNGH